LLVSVCQHFQHISSTLRRWAEEELHLRYLLCPVNAWLDGQESPQFCSSPALASADTTNSIINTLLLGVQSLVATCPIDGDEDSSTEDDCFIRDDCRLHHTRTSILKLSTITDQLNTALPSLSRYPEELLRISLGRLLPFLDRYVELAEDQLSAHSHWVKALFKLLYVLCSVMHTIGKQGFCKPPDSDDSAAGEGAVESGGVGLGEGSGCENVSKEIEEESQVEGLQGETGDAGDSHEERDNDDTIEVDDNFAGDMEDVPDTGSQEVESDEGSQFDPEEQLGTLDPLNSSTLDEKLWGDEEGPAASGEDEKINQDRSHGDDAKAQMVAKDGKTQANKENSRDTDGGDGPTPESDEIPLPEDNDENNDEYPPADVNGAPIDDHIQDADALGLPEDMNLDFETEREDDRNDEAGDDLMDDEPGMDLEEEGDGGSIDDEQASPDGMRNVQQPPAANDETADDVQEDHSAAQPDTSGVGFSQANESRGAANDDQLTGDHDISAMGSGTPEGGVKESDGKQDGYVERFITDRYPNLRDHRPVQANALHDEPQTSGVEAAGSITEGSQHASGPTPQDREPSINPLRSLGDALKEVQKRVREVLERAENTETSREQLHDPTDVSQVEYAQPDDMDYEMQALASAGQEQVVKLKDLKIIADDVEGPAPMDVDVPAEARMPPPTEMPLTIADSESIQCQTQDDAVDAVPRSDIYPRHGLEQGPGASDDTSQGVDREDADVAELEIELRKWQAEGQPSDRTEHMWRLYESLTHSLAYALCEQLRLILEPTRSTRLRGDYRTGKRLNMKRIIQYIASDYTKDKIWLRRTRPSQREYKVLIALDDSRSMAESHSVHLAYQTLALVSTALSRLEVGDIAIVKFGEAVEVVHGFEDGPFTNRAGSKVIDAFKFDQNATNVLALVETSLGILQSARERGSIGSSSAANLWQLEIVISDGVCQDHDRIRNVLRKAEEERVMVVFIIVDSLQSVTRGTTAESTLNQNSILSMKQAAYKMVDGRMELQMNRYLDTFPFEYYVVLRNVEALPEVLCSTLKQFFERISEE
jgi:midasin